MKPHEIGVQLTEDLKNIYQYQAGRWLYRYSNGWRYTMPPRREIWIAMYKHKHAGVVASSGLANEIQQYLEISLTPNRLRKSKSIGQQNEFRLAS